MSSFQPTPFDPLAELGKLNHVVRTLPRAPREGGPRRAGCPEGGRAGGLLWAARWRRRTGRGRGGGWRGVRGDAPCHGGSGPTAELMARADLGPRQRRGRTERTGVGGRWEHADICVRVPPRPPTAPSSGQGQHCSRRGRWTVSAHQRLRVHRTCDSGGVGAPRRGRGADRVLSGQQARDHGGAEPATLPEAEVMAHERPHRTQGQDRTRVCREGLGAGLTARSPAVRCPAILQP